MSFENLFKREKIKSVKKLNEEFELVSKTKGKIVTYTLRNLRTKQLSDFEVFENIEVFSPSFFVCTDKNHYFFIDAKTGKRNNNSYFLEVMKTASGHALVKMKDDSGWAFYNPETDKVSKLRFSNCVGNDGFLMNDWAAMYRAMVPQKGVYVNKDGHLMGKNGRAYEFDEVQSFINKHFAIAKLSPKKRAPYYVFVYANGDLSDEKFYEIKFNFDKSGNFVGMLANFGPGKKYMEVGIMARVTEKSWLDLLAKEPSSFENIPTKWFYDEAFVLKAREVAVSALKSQLSKIENLTKEDAEYFENIYAKIDEKIKKERETVSQLKAKVAAEKQEASEREELEKQEAEKLEIQKREQQRLDAQKAEEEKAEQIARKKSLFEKLK